MKILIKTVKNNQFSVLLTIFSLGAAEIICMEALIKKDSQLQRRIAANLEQREAQKRGWYVYGAEGEQHKILIDEEILTLSQTIKNMLEDIGYESKVTFPLEKLSINTIKNCFNLIQLYNQKPNAFYQKIHTLTSDELLTILSCIDYLQLPEHFKNAFMTELQKQMTTYTELIESPQFMQLDPEAQKLLMINPTTDCLTTKIIKKYTQKRPINLVGHPNPVNSVAFSPDGTKIVSGSYGLQNNLIVCDAKTGQQLFNLTGYPGTVNSVAFSPDGTKIVSGSVGNQNNLIVWDAKTGQQLLNLDGHPGTVNSVAFSPDGTKIVSGSSGLYNNLIVWDAKTGQQLLNLFDTGTVNSVAFSPDGTKIVSGGHSLRNNLIVWDAMTGKRLFNLVGHPNPVNSVAFSPNGTKIVSGSSGNQNNLIVWDAETGQKISNLVGHLNTINTVAFSLDGTKIVSGSSGNQNNLIVWDAETGQKILNLVGHLNTVNTVAFSSDDTKIVSGGSGNHNNLIIWTLLTNQEETILKNIPRLTAPQIRLLYQLCLQPSKASINQLKGNDRDIFNSLPDDMQNLLKSFFEIKPKGWLSGWW
jgi:WD40 repeat protein